MSVSALHRLRIIVLGYVVRGPLGGMVWSNLQYLQGLARLGHDVYFLEDSDDYPSCYDPRRWVTDTDPTYGLRFAEEVFGRIGFGARWAYHDAHTARWHGPCAERMLDLCASAELVLNLCGVNPLRPWLLTIPARALIDEDPAFMQIRHLTDPAARKRALQHTAFFSFGENIGGSGCTIPSDGLPWRPTRQPVVMDTIPLAPAAHHGRFTTVMQWESYPAKECQGVRYGMKDDSLLPLIELPRRVSAILELAIGSASAPRALLQQQGWMIRDPRKISRDPWTYERYLRESKAEFSVAKHGYVISRSGWFSERSAAYLAMGRPVVTQQTGFSDWLRADAGVLPFETMEEAIEAIEEVEAHYSRHREAARAVAETYFDAMKILPRLLEDVLRPAEVARESCSAW